MSDPISVELKVSPDYLYDDNYIKQKLAIKLRKLSWSGSFYHALDRRSVDARGKEVVFILRFKVSKSELKQSVGKIYNLESKNSKRSVIIVGAGPAGYFAALELLKQGIRPIILERGKDVQSRRRDLKLIQQDGHVNPNSNYCFGEGGAGTYSDGKLYTRSLKRGRKELVLETLVNHGASQDILVDAHPHIGSNKLPKIISSIRNTIERLGGEVHFESKVVGFLIDKEVLKGVKTESKEFTAEATILATGHSARGIFRLLDSNGVHLEYKPFAMGVRVEHPQSFIDEKQYGSLERHKNLGAAAYKLVAQASRRGVYSFCMCPGGLIVPAATEPGEVVVNGMSLSRRDSPFSNSGIVVQLLEEDIPKLNGLQTWESALEYQSSLEKNMFKLGDGSQKAPAQKLQDFVEGRRTEDSHQFESSYIPGLHSVDLNKELPDFISNRLRSGFQTFDRKMSGYLHEGAVVVGVESRTSSPIRIPRNDICQSPDLKGLFPCGEGAGYAGGIVSAALDGINVARNIAHIDK